MQLSEADDAETSARVSDILPTHVLVGHVTLAFAVFMPVDISALLSDALTRSPGNRPMWLL
jgi:hypothetical protein